MIAIHVLLSLAINICRDNAMIIRGSKRMSCFQIGRALVTGKIMPLAAFLRAKTSDQLVARIL